MRLDNIIFRTGFAKTIPQARQLINHGHILVNNRKINIPSYNCKNQDKIKVKKLEIIQENINHQEVNKLIPVNLITNLQEFEINISNNFNNNEIGLKINELLVIEYYSRS